jgi:hypothetical protein
MKERRARSEGWEWMEERRQVCERGFEVDVRDPVDEISGAG